MHPLLARVIYNEDSNHYSPRFTPWRLIAMLPKIELVARDSANSGLQPQRISEKQLASIRQLLWHWAVDELIAQPFLENLVPLRGFVPEGTAACALSSSKCFGAQNASVRWVYPYLHSFIGDLKEMEKGLPKERNSNEACFAALRALLINQPFNFFSFFIFLFYNSFQHQSDVLSLLLFSFFKSPKELAGSTSTRPSCYRKLCTG